MYEVFLEPVKMQGCQTLLGDSFVQVKLIWPRALLCNVFKMLLFQIKATCKDAGLPNVARRLEYNVLELAATELIACLQTWDKYSRTRSCWRLTLVTSRTQVWGLGRLQNVLEYL